MAALLTISSGSAGRSLCVLPHATLAAASQCTAGIRAAIEQNVAVHHA
jgi:hypothetical protein